MTDQSIALTHIALSTCCSRFPSVVSSIHHHPKPYPKQWREAGRRRWRGDFL